MKNTSESDPPSYKVITYKQLQIKAPTGFEHMTSIITGVMLYQLSYEASLESISVNYYQ